MKKASLLLILFLLNACCSTPPSPVDAETKTALSSHDPLTDAQLDHLITLLRDPHTNPDVSGYIIDRLATENYDAFHTKIRTSYGVAVPLGDGTEYIMSSAPRDPQFYQAWRKQVLHNHESELVFMQEWQLIEYHIPESGNELNYYQSMLDFMELPIPYARKINGLKNIQRVMGTSHFYHDLKDPEMAEIRSRLYALTQSKTTPDNLRNELMVWLKEMR